MKVVSAPQKDDDGHQSILVTINNKDIGVILSAIRWYIQKHKKDPDELIFKQLWDIEVELRDTLDLLRD